ncbi:polysaccharide deacetylase family protein [Scleromatobacter humisilvae]|uniref:Polysaccharide deacetylase family protein n=1 Tax=Scleromatobacter humisilvae TaxID=2897159 RepID=A0A9X1YHC1_9BURK|nr:polysaccharide deacetylase family protein [Scleromatobacter humisilvae]MCK9686339.1 polysaccharide deacetylase family protein [Scleromatobacter humisilvae]
MSRAVRAVSTVVSPAGQRAKLLTFFFHRVLEKPDPMIPGEMHATQFDEALRWIGDQFRVLPPLEACERLATGTLPARAAIISFDDGYRDNHDVALPLLKRHRMTAAFFVATGYLGDGVQFNDRLTEAVRAHAGDSFDAGWLGLGILPTGDLPARLRTLHRLREGIKYLPPAERNQALERIESACGLAASRSARDRVMMTPEEVQVLAANGMEIGGHTVMHPILKSVDDDTAFEEIRLGRDALAALLPQPPRLFAYPNGKLGTDFDPRHADMARRAGFSYAFSTQRGAADARTDRMMLPRFMPWDRQALRFKLQALKVLLGR